MNVKRLFTLILLLGFLLLIGFADGLHAQSETWKTYHSQKAKYSFNYPASWPLVTVSTQSHEDILAFTPHYDANSSEPMIAWVSVYKHENIKDFDDFKNKQINIYGQIIDVQDTKVGQEKAISYQVSEGIPPLPIREYVVFKNGLEYRIALMDSEETNKNREKNIALFDQMLKTFKFE